MGIGNSAKESKLSLHPLLNERVVAELLNVKIKTLQSWRVRGCGLKFVKLGHLVRYRGEDLRDYLDSQVRTTTGC